MEKAICEMGGLDFVRNTLQVESTEGPNFPIQPPFSSHSAVSVFNTESRRLVRFYCDYFRKKRKKSVLNTVFFNFSLNATPAKLNNSCLVGNFYMLLPSIEY